jgi:methionyl-tRNA formyltransferase
MEVALVVTQPDRPAGRSRDLRASPIKLLAGELGLPVAQPEKLSDPAGVELLRGVAPEVAVVVSYGQILRQGVLDLPRLGCLNVHGSALPRHRGASPIQSAILAGDATSGVTVIRMDSGVDTGPVVSLATAPVLPRDTYETLHDRLAALGGTMIAAAVRGVADGTIVPVGQDPALATRCRTIRKQDGFLDWSRTAVDLDRAVRALNPWPGTFGTLVRRTGAPLDLAILAAEPVAGHPGAAPGSVTRSEGAEFVVATGAGGLAIRSVRPAGKKPMTAAELLRGYELSPGDAFRPAPP